MSATAPTLTQRALGIMGLNTVIALGLTTVGYYQGWWGNLVYSQCIGLSIWTLVELGRHALAPGGQVSPRQMALIVPVAVLLGYFGGRALGHVLYGVDPGRPYEDAPHITLGFLLLSLVAGGFGSYWFMSREALAAARLAQQEAQRQASEARLKLLETQLEPHMLFNTLANLRVLIGIDPERAIVMLDHMNDYLRATLSGSRASLHPLHAEFDRLADYLELMTIRMGPRLRYQLALPDDLRALPVPPLLLQPLVENAIRHGLEPQVQGGQITVSAQRLPTGVRLQVADSGVGLPAQTTSDPQPGHGFGLSQVRERLHTTFGPAAHLHLEPLPGGGTQVTLDLPTNPPAA